MILGRHAESSGFRSRGFSKQFQANSTIKADCRIVGEHIKLQFGEALCASCVDRVLDQRITNAFPRNSGFTESA